MATKMYFRAGGVLSTSAGTSTTANISLSTSVAEVFFGAWVSGAIRESFTLSGTISVSMQASETNMSANVGGRVKIYKFTAADGTKTLIASGDDGVEFSTANTQMDWTVTPTATNFSTGDQLVVELYGGPVGTIGYGYYAALYYDGADGSAYDSSITLTETLVFTSPLGKGYFAGGYNPTSSTDIDGINYATQAAVNPSSALSSDRHHTAGTFSQVKGYVGGGENASATINTISSFTFATETAADISAQLATARAWHQSLSSGTTGYWMGGLATRIVISSNTNEVDGIVFATEAAYNPSFGLPTAKRGGTTITMPSVRGYLLNAYLLNTTYANTNDRFVFSTEAFSTTGNNLGTAASVGLESAIKGFDVYYYGAVAFPFSNDTTYVSYSSLPTSFGANGTGVSGAVAGFVGGNATPTTDIIGYNFAAENAPFVSSATLSATKVRAAGFTTSRALDLPPGASPSGKATLTCTLIKVISTHSNKGYILGSRHIAGNVFYQNVVRVDFSTDIRTLLGTQLPVVTYGYGGLSSGEKGYAVGGYNTGAATPVESITYGTEALANLAQKLNADYETAYGWSSESTGFACKATACVEMAFSTEVFTQAFAVTGGGINFGKHSHWRNPQATAGYTKSWNETNKFTFNTKTFTHLGTAVLGTSVYECAAFNSGRYAAIVGFSNTAPSTTGFEYFDNSTETFFDYQAGLALPHRGTPAQTLSGTDVGHSFGGWSGTANDTAFNKLVYATRTVTVGSITLGAEVRHQGVPVSNAFPTGPKVWAIGTGMVLATVQTTTTLGIGLVHTKTHFCTINPGSGVQAESVGILSAVQSESPQAANGPNDGYFFGGKLVTGGTLTTRAYKCSFAGLTLIDLTATLSTARAFGGDNLGNGIVGFAAAGTTATETAATSTEKLTFATELFSASSAALTIGRNYPANLSNANYGFTFGGYNGGNLNSTQRLTFNTETYAAIATYLYEGRKASQAVNDDTNGFIVGGEGYSATVYTTDRFDLQTQTLFPQAAVADKREKSASCNTKIYGYMAAGEYFIGASSASIIRISYDTGTAITTSTGSVAAGWSAVGAGSRGSLRTVLNTKGTAAATGATMPGAGSGYLSLGTVYDGYYNKTHEKFAYGTDTRSTITISGAPSSSKTTGTSSGAVGFVPTYFYYVSGWTNQEVFGLAFFTETTHRFASGFIQSDTEPTSAATTGKAKGHISTSFALVGFNYHTYVQATIAARAGVMRNMLGAPDYSYWKQFNSGNSTYFLAKAAYTTEAITEVILTFPNASKNGSGTLQSKTYGYHAGGWLSPNPLSEITRITFASDTVGSIAATLGTARSRMGGLTATPLGYLAGGSPTDMYSSVFYTSSVSVVEKLNFTTEAVSVGSFSLSIGLTGQASLWNTGGAYGSFTAAGDSSLTAGGTIAVYPAANMNGAGAVSATATTVETHKKGAAVAAGAGAISVAGTVKPAILGAAVLVGAGTIYGAAVTSGTITCAAVMVGQGALVAVGNIVVTWLGAANLAGAGGVSCYGNSYRTGAALHGGGGTLVANGHVSRNGQAIVAVAATVLAKPHLVAGGRAQAEGAALLTGRAVLDLGAAASVFGAGAITSRVRLVSEFLQWLTTPVRPKASVESAHPIVLDAWVSARPTAALVHLAGVEKMVRTVSYEIATPVKSPEALVTCREASVSLNSIERSVMVNETDIVTELGT